MSTHRKREWLIFGLGIAGSLFSGYLSAVKFLSDTCAFNESCPYFLGLPACYFGFALFLCIAVFAGSHVFHVLDGMKANRAVLRFSVLGVCFAGYFTILELPMLFREGLSAYLLGLPTCALGLLCFAAVAMLSYRLRSDFKPPTQP